MRYPSVAEALRLRALKEQLSAARVARGDTLKPAPPTPDEMRIGAADRARHSARDMDDVRLHDAVARWEREDARQWDEERAEMKVVGAMEFTNDAKEDL